MSTPQDEKREKIKVRWWHIVLIAFFVCAFLGLAYWQWTRFQSGSGDFQNLGYALQWPLFAAFVIYAYRMSIKYENERIEAESEAAKSGEEDFQFQAETPDTKVTKISEDFLPERPQMDVAEFNERNAPRRRKAAKRGPDEAADNMKENNDSADKQ